MIYPFACPKCRTDFDVVKHHTEYISNEECPQCGSPSDRIYTPLSVPKPEKSEYNHGLGCVVKNNRHKKEICKKLGVVEIGNEPVEKIVKHDEKRLKQKLDSRWENV